MSPLGMMPFGAYELSDDRADPVNQCMARYFGLRSIRGSAPVSVEKY